MRKDTEQLIIEMQKLRTELFQTRVDRDAEKARANTAEQVVKLKQELVDLQIRADKIKEDHARERRELEHKVGLEKMRQEQELSLAKREALVDVRESNLEADRTRFEDQMSFVRSRFEEEATESRKLMSQILDRLPTVTVDRTIEERRTTRAVPK